MFGRQKIKETMHGCSGLRLDEKTPAHSDPMHSLLTSLPPRLRLSAIVEACPPPFTRHPSLPFLSKGFEFCRPSIWYCWWCSCSWRESFLSAPFLMSQLWTTSSSLFTVCKTQKLTLYAPVWQINHDFVDFKIRRDHQKNFYERRDYELVDEKSLS